MENRRVVEKPHDIAEIKHEHWNSHDPYTPHGGRTPAIHYRFFVGCSQLSLSKAARASRNCPALMWWPESDGESDGVRLGESDGVRLGESDGVRLCSWFLRAESDGVRLCSWFLRVMVSDFVLGSYVPSSKPKTKSDTPRTSRSEVQILSPDLKQELPVALVCGGLFLV